MKKWLSIFSLSLLVLVGCKSSISTTQYQADFEKTDRTLESISTYTGKKQTVQLSKLNVNKELWETFPELREKSLGLGVSNRIVENLLYTNRFEFTEEKDAVVNQIYFYLEYLLQLILV